ncbi:MAG: hypothetical protein L6R36_000908 [Xanthoria steineri]|nr:MAG: hypothetical protein L6R36_000908 [Xanthoria steineri]
MPTLGDLRVIISVDKQNRTDYHDEDTTGQDAKFISRYVECKSGASFSIDISIKRTTKFKSDAIVFYVYIDGHDAYDNIITKDVVSCTSGAVYFFRVPGATRKIADKWEFRPFMFGEIKHVEQVSELTAKQYDRKMLGSIEVKAYHVTQRDVDAAKNHSWDEAEISSQVALSEKQLKGSSATHAAKYVTPWPLVLARWASEISNASHVGYLVKARPTALLIDNVAMALQSMLIIPRTPSPPPPPRPIPLEERPVEMLAMEELQQLVRRQRKENRTAEPHAKSKLESALDEQHVKLEGKIKRPAGIKSEQEVKPETGVKRERDEEMEEILASAYVKRSRNKAPVDLTDV